MKLNKTEIEFVLAMMSTISDSPVSYEAVRMKDVDNDEIFNIARSLRSKLEGENLDEFEAEEGQGLTYEEVVNHILQSDKNGCNVLCDHDEYDLITCYVYLNINNRLQLQNDSEVDIDINDLDFVAILAE